MAEDTPQKSISYRIHREASGLFAWFRQTWRERKWFRFGGYALGALVALYFLVWVLVCLLYTSPSPRDQRGSRMPSSA